MDYAQALGVRIHSNMDRETLSKRMDKAKAKMKKRANRNQKALAKRFGLEFDSAAVGWKLVDLLFNFLTARAWAYSVARHVAGKTWKRHAQCVWSESIVNAISRELVANDELFDVVCEKQHSSSASTDVWFRITEKTSQSEAYVFVAERLPQQRLGCVAAVGYVTRITIATVCGLLAAAIFLWPESSYGAKVFGGCMLAIATLLFVKVRIKTRFYATSHRAAE